MNRQLVQDWVAALRSGWITCFRRKNSFKASYSHRLTRQPGEMVAWCRTCGRDSYGNPIGPVPGALPGQIGPADDAPNE